MLNQLIKVEQFQKTFGAGVEKIPTLVPPETSSLRFKLMQEENNEYKDAVIEGNLIEVADALGDMLYILCGTILEHGMQNIIEEVFDEIHRSNLSKTDENGKPIINGQNGVLDETRAMGKVLKSERYSKPNLKPIIDRDLEKNKSDKALNLLRKQDLLKTMVRTAKNNESKAEFNRLLEETNEEIMKLNAQFKGEI